MTNIRKTGKHIIAMMFLFSFYLGHTFGQQASTGNNYLKYIPVTQNSDYLNASLILTADINSLQVVADLKLINTGSKSITVTGVTVYADGGLQSFPTNGNIKPINLKAGQDGLLTVNFKPINDIKVYQLTGKQGRIKAQYKVAVFYKSQGQEQVFSTNLIAQLPADTYRSYIDRHPISYTGYAFNTASTFDQTERKYIEQLKLKDQPFVFIAQHELALTGLNIWMTSYLEKDTLYADLLIVNHDDFAIKLHPGALNFGSQDEVLTDKAKTITVEKIISKQKDPERIDKGDKISVHFKRYFKNTDKPIFLSFKNAFLLNGTQPLFIDNIGLVKVHLQ